MEVLTTCPKSIRFNIMRVVEVILLSCCFQLSQTSHIEESFVDKNRNGIMIEITKVAADKPLQRRRRLKASSKYETSISLTDYYNNQYVGTISLGTPSQDLQVGNKSISISTSPIYH
jgi:hypothetical protein